jgi:quercetin dioxygenase-like cupin family protein
MVARKEAPVSRLREIQTITPIQVWTGVRARVVEGERLTMALVELDAGAVVPEHRHPNEQLGMVIHGALRFRIGDEERELGPGGTWRIAADLPHEVHVGPDGAVVMDIFAPIRADWHDLADAAPRPIVWPGALEGSE